MFKNLYPSVHVDSIYNVDFEKLYKRGIRGIIFDIDNTLVPHNAPADERSEALIRKLRDMGFSCFILSNNSKERVELFNKNLNIPYISKAGKPKREGYLQAIDSMGLSLNQVIFAGDQLFTDVWGANRAGIKSIHGDVIDKNEPWNIKLKRMLEKPIFACYKRHKKKNDKK